MKRVTVSCLAALVVAAVASVAPVSAGELVRFQDGRYLEVERHEVRGDAVRLILAPGAVVACSTSQVEWIERAGLRVWGDSDELARTRRRSRSVAEGETLVRARPEPEVREVARDFPAGTPGLPLPLR